jgi:hypothetical protein
VWPIDEQPEEPEQLDECLKDWHQEENACESRTRIASHKDCYYFMLQNKMRSNTNCFHEGFIKMRDEGWHGLHHSPFYDFLDDADRST